MYLALIVRYKGHGIVWPSASKLSVSLLDLLVLFFILSHTFITLGRFMTRQMQNNSHLANNYQLVTERQQLIDLLVLLKLKLQDLLFSNKNNQKCIKNSTISHSKHQASSTSSISSSFSSISSSRYNPKNNNNHYQLQRFKINHYGHMFNSSKLIFLPNKSTFCEVCTQPIIFNKAEQCQNCNIYTHPECSFEITRPCAKTENLEYIKQLYNYTPHSKSFEKIQNNNPEEEDFESSIENSFYASPKISPTSLHCYECKQKHPNQLKHCSLTGYFYCKNCHWDDRAVIPANVLYNWDFTRLSVCRRSFHILQEFQNQPLINISKCNNGQLFRKIKKLGKVHRMRRKLMDMYEYIGKCKLAKNDRLLQKSLKSRCGYFLIDEKSVFYSLVDLVDIATGKLYRELKTVEAIFEDHIRRECLICKGRGHICKICNQGSQNLVNFDEPMFPFDKEGISTCGDCGSVYHENCYSDENFECVTCKMYEKRKQARKEALGPEPSNYTDGMKDFLVKSSSFSSLGELSYSNSSMGMTIQNSVISRSSCGLKNNDNSNLVSSFGTSPTKASTLWSVAEENHDDEEEDILFRSSSNGKRRNAPGVDSGSNFSKFSNNTSPRDENSNRVGINRSKTSPLGFQHPFFQVKS